jgi:queuine tRNA-ribosyltransferase
MPFDGFAIGGLSIGESPDLMQKMTAFTAPLLPLDRPRYLMGVGRPEDLVEGVRAGVDMFDCVLPTRIARNGTLYTSQGRVNIANAKWANEAGPIDPACACRVCRRHSAAYLRHLHQCNEILGAQLATYHNLHFYARLMEGIRSAIETDSFLTFRAQCLANWSTDEEKK